MPQKELEQVGLRGFDAAKAIRYNEKNLTPEKEQVLARIFDQVQLFDVKGKAYLEVPSDPLKKAEFIWDLQKFLGINKDGKFGEQTVKAAEKKLAELTVKTSVPKLTIRPVAPEEKVDVVLGIVDATVPNIVAPPSREAKKKEYDFIGTFSITFDFKSGQSKTFVFETNFKSKDDRPNNRTNITQVLTTGELIGFPNEYGDAEEAKKAIKNYFTLHGGEAVAGYSVSFKRKESPTEEL